MTIPEMVEIAKNHEPYIGMRDEDITDLITQLSHADEDRDKSITLEAFLHILETLQKDMDLKLVDLVNDNFDDLVEESK